MGLEVTSFSEVFKTVDKRTYQNPLIPSAFLRLHLAYYYFTTILATYTH